MSKFISLFTDFGFKRVFGQEENKKFLIGFLNSLFDGEFVVTDLHYRDKEQPPETKEERGVIFDIHCPLADGRHLIIEMQNQTCVNFAGRVLTMSPGGLSFRVRRANGNMNTRRCLACISSITKTRRWDGVFGLISESIRKENFLSVKM